MNKLFKLIVLVLISVFLIGCSNSKGSSGGNGPVDAPIDSPIDEPVDEPVDEPIDEPIDEPVDEEKLSLELLRSSSPVIAGFGGIIISKATSSISYDALSQSEIDDFTAALITKGFTPSSDDTYIQDTSYGAAKAYILGDSIQLSVFTEGLFAEAVRDINHNSTIFQEIFPPIGAKIGSIAMDTFLSSRIGIDWLDEENRKGLLFDVEYDGGFECRKRSNVWICKKTADGVEYEYSTEINTTLISYKIFNAPKDTIVEEEPSLELLKSSFPDFGVASSGIVKIESSIYHDALSIGRFYVFVNALWENFTPDDGRDYAVSGKDTPYGLARVKLNYGPSAIIYDDPEFIELSMFTDENVNHSSALYEEVFPPVEVEALDVTMRLYYGGDITSGFEEYMEKLDKDGFECQEETYECKKTVGKIDYEWYGEEDLMSYKVSNHLWNAGEW